MKHCHFSHSDRSSAGTAAWSRVHIVAAFVVLAGLLAACSGKAKPAEDDYSGQAKYSYEEGMEALEGGDYLEASKQFNYVRTKFPYSKYATLATLRVADTHFKQDQYPEAIEAYRRFIQLHPTHPDVPYAQYKIGISFYEELPGDWFFMPPAYEKDLTSTEDAERELRKFLELYPNTQYAEDVGEKLAIVRQRLADHEFFVATFYMQQEQPRAAAMRLQVLLERFPGIGFDQEALFLLGKSYLLLKDVGQAVHTWKQLIDQYPDHPLAVEADNYIRTHDLRVPPPAETETEPAADAPEPPAARLTGSSTDSAEDREPEASPDASPDDVEPPEAYDDPTEETEP